MAIFNVKKPTLTGWEWFTGITARLFFPPILIWDLSKYLINSWLGKTVGSAVLPAQDLSFIGAIVDIDTNELTHEQHTVRTHDGVELDTLEVYHSSQKNIAPQYQKYIINLVGNGMIYEQVISEMKDDAKELNINVVGFNYRGVRKSTGRAKSKNDLVTDGIAQVQRLIDQGVAPQNITLKGHSLGGAVASLVAEYFHRHGQPINVFNDRSFSSITNFLIGHIRRGGNEAGHQETIGGKFLGWLIKPFFKLGLALVKWEINAGDAFKAIPEEYREYMLVRTRKKIRTPTVLDDTVIPHYASIHVALTDERRAKKDEIAYLITKTKRMIKRNAEPSMKRELETVREALTEAKAKLKDRKMENCGVPNNGHNEQMDKLTNRYGKHADTFFREFVQRAYNEHAVKELSP